MLLMQVKKAFEPGFVCTYSYQKNSIQLNCRASSTAT